MYKSLVLDSILCVMISLPGIYGSAIRVVGGREVPEHYGRYHASLQNVTGHHVCGGAIVSEIHVVTAAHCVLGADPQYIKIVVGTTDLDRGGKQYDADKIIIYDSYDFDLKLHDIAIIKSKKPFDKNYIQILDLYLDNIEEGDPLILTGFGAIQPNGESSRQMHELMLTVFNQETCQFAMRYTREVFDSMFCTFTKFGEGTCHGDSGGPLVKEDKLVGLVSWGIPCAVGFPDVHTRITPYINWIHKNIALACFQ